MKRFDLLLDTNPPRSAYCDGEKLIREENEWLIYRDGNVVGRFRADRVLGITMAEILEQP